jgi:3-dehydroquinate synthase
MIEIDDFDAGSRKVFNYGHTFGHAIEAASGFGVSHGIAVSIDMDVANCLSAKQGLVSIKFRNRVRKVLEKIWQADRLDKVKLNEFISALKKDKKNDGR